MYEQYCRAVAETAAWGGQVELGALAALLQRRITVYSVGMPAVDMGPDAAGATPQPSYHQKRSATQALPQTYRKNRVVSGGDILQSGKNCSMVSAHG